VPPEPRPVQPGTVLALSRTRRAGCAGAAAFAGGILDCRCARGSAGKAGRDEGMVLPIEQKDVVIDLSKPIPVP
jgi:hypothetical protein